MSTHYQYYLEWCKCNQGHEGTSGKDSYYFDYYKRICVCGDREITIGMRNLDGEEVSHYPVEVYNVNEELIGGAESKQQYIDLWNSDPANQAIGTLTSASGQFLFGLKIKPNQVAPPWVLGVSGDIEEGIYAIEYADEYE